MTEELLWTFALAFYAKPSVSKSCIRCQDESKADVTIILLMLWCAVRGYIFNDSAALTVEAYAYHWRTHVVAPLRDIRRWIPKGMEDTFRKQIVDAELMAERIALSRLGAASFELEKVYLLPSEAARISLSCYERTIGHALPSEAVQSLLAILDTYVCC